ncbi:hypothetical protein HDU96_004280 [Phlyctochytrium bullatum]|nr:hypothetical protein HDU96_004280 [Phlyctochytrium bullatum]
MHILFLAVALFAAAVSAKKFEGPTVIEEIPDGPTIIEEIQLKDELVKALPFPRSSLPEELRGDKAVDISTLGEFLSVKLGSGTQKRDAGVRFRLSSGKDIMTAARSTVEILPRDGVCAELHFPDKSYEGVAISFYTSQSEDPFSKLINGGGDMMDFSFLGSTNTIRVSYSQQGISSGLPDGIYYDIPNDKFKKVVHLCIINMGHEVRWYVDGKVVKAVPGRFSRQWVWFTMRENKRCCGKAKQNNWTIDLRAMTMFAVNKEFLDPVPLEVYCAPKVKCPDGDSMSKFGIFNRRNSAVSVSIYTEKKTIRACNNEPYVPQNDYREFCLPKLDRGDKLEAYDKDGTKIPLEWAALKPKGNYYEFNLKIVTEPIRSLQAVHTEETLKNGLTSGGDSRELMSFTDPGF